MSKGIIVVDMPKKCFECPFRYDGEEVSIGRYTYQQLHKCLLTPNEHIGECLEDHVKDIMIGKPEWCPIRPMSERAYHENYCDNLRERDTAKDVIHVGERKIWYRCPVCEADLSHIKSEFCPFCGQRLKWMEEW